MSIKLDFPVDISNVVKQVRLHTDCERLLKRFPKPAFIIHDTETNGLYPFEPNVPYWNPDGSYRETNGAEPFCHFIGILDPVKNIFHVGYIPSNDTEMIEALGDIMVNTSVVKVGHNYKFDMGVCRKLWTVKGKIFDTMTASRMLYDRLPSHSLKSLANYFFFDVNSSTKSDPYEKQVKSFLSKKKAVAKKEHPLIVPYLKAKTKVPKALNDSVKEELDRVWNYSCLPEELLIPYGAKDIVYTFMLMTIFGKDIYGDFNDLFALEMDLIHIANKMESNGIAVSQGTVEKNLVESERNAAKALKRLCRRADKMGFPGFNPSSPKQLLRLLKHFTVDETDTTMLVNKKGSESSDKEIINRMAMSFPNEPFFSSLLEYRAYTKLGHYFKAFKKFTGDFEIPRLHCNIRVSDTATGRTACSDPNLQNIPNIKGIDLSVRECFVPAPGKQLAFFDYSQIEMRVFALFCQDEKMLQGLRDGKDFHAACSEVIFGNMDPENRKFCKGINFGLIYGMGASTLATSLGVPIEQAIEFKADYFANFPRAKVLSDTCKSMLYRLGYVEDMFGRRYHVPMDFSYKAVNSLVQGASANVLKMAIWQLNRAIYIAKRFCGNKNLLSQCKILLPIHDELILEVPQNADDTLYAQIKFIMERIYPVNVFNVATVVEASSSTGSWALKKEMKLTNPELLETAKIMSFTLDDIARKHGGNVFHKGTLNRKIDWFMPKH